MDSITILILVFGGFGLTIGSFLIGFLTDIDNRVFLKRMLGMTRGVVAVRSKDGTYKFYSRNLDNPFIDTAGRTRFVRENCVYTGKLGNPHIEYDLDSAEPMRRKVFIKTEVLKLGADGKPLLNDKGEQQFEVVDCEYRQVDVDPVVLNTDKNLLMDWAQSSMWKTTSLTLGLIIAILAVSTLSGIWNATNLSGVHSEIADVKSTCQAIQSSCIQTINNTSVNSIKVIGGH